LRTTNKRNICFLSCPPDAQTPAVLDEFGPMPNYDIAWYEPAWNNRRKKSLGYLLVFAPQRSRGPQDESLAHGEFIDLTANIWSTRIQRQAAGLIYADVEGGSLELGGKLKAAFSFTVPLAGAPRFVHAAPTLRLFPTPNRDSCLRDLLSAVPFRDDPDQRYAFRRTLAIPEYYESFDKAYGSRDWRRYRSTDQYVRSAFIFQKLIAIEPPIEQRFGARTVLLRDAIAVLTPWQFGFVYQPEPRAVGALADGARGVFMEYDELRSSFSASPENIPCAASGVWVVHHEGRYWCRVFVRFPDSSDEQMGATDGHTFELHDHGELRVKDASPIDDLEVELERRLLSVTLGLSMELAQGRRRLTAHEFRPYHVLSDVTRPGIG
jgi:hypothetical protein